MEARRTTITAPREALATLEAEARRRGSSLNAVLVDAVVEKAQALRDGRRPRVGVARSTDGRAAEDVASQPVARPPS